ncbi:hypothetical protein CQZ93_08025 [Ochrobactrum vermis]|nr:hypothetical protein CQZ93_08025 [Ochrobactrum vermis]
MLIGHNLLKIKADGRSRSAFTRIEFFREIKSGAQKKANQVKGFVRWLIKACLSKPRNHYLLLTLTDKPGG